MDTLLRTLLPFPTSHANETAPPLYSPSDLVGLNPFEDAWARFFLWVGNPALATAILVFVTHEVSSFPTLLSRQRERSGGRGKSVSSRADPVRVVRFPLVRAQVVYFGRSLPFVVMDLTGWGLKWKIQPVRLLSSSLH